MRRFILLALAACLVAPFVAFDAPAGTWTNCSASAAITNLHVASVHQVLCFEFDDDTDSGQFTVSTPSALLQFDPDITTEGADTAQINIRRCHRGTKPSSSPENQCLALLAAPLDGAVGNDTERLGTGVYYIDITTSAAGDDAVVSITGE